MVMDNTNFNPLPNKADNTLIPYLVFDELYEPAMIYGGVVIGGEVKIFQIILKVRELLHAVTGGNAEQTFRRHA